MSEQFLLENEQIYSRNLKLFEMYDECINAIENISAYEEIFEASKNNINVKISNNDKIEKKSGGILKKILDGIATMIKNIGNSIASFFVKRSFNAQQRAAYEEFKKAAAKDPSLKNKKISAYDYMKMMNEYKAYLKEIEEAEKSLASGKDFNVQPLIDKITTYLSSSGKAVTTAMTCETVLNLASSSQDIAKLFSDVLGSSDKLQKALAENIGDKQSKKFTKELEQMTKKRSMLLNIKLKLTGRTCDSVTSAMEKSIKDVLDLVKSGVSVAGIAKDTEGLGIGAKAKYYLDHKKEIKNIGSAAKRNIGLGMKVYGNEDVKSMVDTVKGINDKAHKRAKERVDAKNGKHVENQSGVDSLFGRNHKNK